MSKKFIYKISEKDSLSEDNNYIIENCKNEFDTQNLRTLIVPETKASRATKKDLIECLVNELEGITQRMSCNVNENNMTEDGFDIYFLTAIRSLGDFMQYMINSDSFQNAGSIQPYDYAEYMYQLNGIMYSIKQSSTFNVKDRT